MATRTSLPPDVQQLAAAHRARQQQIAAQAVAETNRLWGFVETLGWASVAGQMLSTAQSALMEAARGVQGYVGAAVRMWGREPDPFGQVAERTFAATASDGRPLDTLLEQPALEVVELVDQGMTRAQADAIGRRHLQRIVATQVADAARVATGVAMVNDRVVEGYIRHLTLPSCNRCILLSGRWYRYDAGFDRHPLCDCVGIPAAEVVDPPRSPREIYNSLDDEERRKAGWSGHDQRAIEDGADLFRVTNYRRALKTVTIAGRPVKTTLVGTTRRGLAGKRGAKVRMTPEAIYLEADRLNWDREETLRMLKLHGYVV
ncbi:hypothetical protein Drose_04245 [Dactylosporangium roseum]|uniref:Phage head morphogenesis domain-containing protein n=1 Tax=Dactylosporangium roseum TaxID=47989 RepID=A0ABY5Z910_9ACTN|nr:hypothetical protein [Dactylosporangium roseum]UWZ37500.1 hypothetical protein Drose_04245 [Dactylosporangium roseum]